MTGVSAAGLAALAGCSGGNGGGSGTEEPMETEDPTDTPISTPTDTATPTPEPTAAPDVPILNYALTLEHLENAFYRDALETFADDEIAGASVLSGVAAGIRRGVPDELRRAGDHEAAHVDALSATVENLGGTPVEEASYEWGYETPSEFLETAAAVENTGVAAYAGAAPRIANNDVLAAAAGIHSVEARHAALLNVLVGDSPYPAGVDEAKSVDAVLEIASNFVTSEVDASAFRRADDAAPDLARAAENDVSDVEVLNYALTLEHLENAFYRDGLDDMSDTRIVNADALAPFSESSRNAVPDRLRTIGAHEQAHVDALTATVEDLGGDPVEEAEYDFGYTDASEFLGVARALENTGVSAYAGAAPTVANDDVFAAAIGIHSVEARHASFLNRLNGEPEYPAAVDEPRTMSEVREIAGQFIVG
ncbi:MAG: ferritin-like domain-containing protein [Haloferacaceae archaeon]